MDNNKKTVVFKIVGDVLMIGLKVGTIIIEWKVLGKVNKADFTRFQRFIVGYVTFWAMEKNGIDVYKRAVKLKDIYKGYRQRRIKEDADRMNELVKDIRTDVQMETDKSLEEAIEEFKEIGRAHV